MAVLFLRHVEENKHIKQHSFVVVFLSTRMLQHQCSLFLLLIPKKSDALKEVSASWQRLEGHPDEIIIVIMDIFIYRSGPGCSKLTMSLVNDSLKFTSSDTQIC